MITAGTLYKKHIFNTPEKKSLLQDILFELIHTHELSLKAWAIFSNHYHIIIENWASPLSLPKFLNDLHRISATELNKMDHAPERRIWYKYWDTLISNRNSYFSRIKYVMENPVKQNIVKIASDYEWCSAWWFENFSDQ